MGIYLVSIKKDFYIRPEWTNKSKIACQYNKQYINWGYLVGILYTYAWTWNLFSQNLFFGFKVSDISFPPSTKKFTFSDKLIRNITDGKSVWQDLYLLYNYLLDLNDILQDTTCLYGGILEIMTTYLHWNRGYFRWKLAKNTTIL